MARRLLCRLAMRSIVALVIAFALAGCGDAGGSDAGCVLSSCDPDCPGLPADGLACTVPGKRCDYEAAYYTCGSDDKWRCHAITTGSNYPCPPLDMARAGD